MSDAPLPEHRSRRWVAFVLSLLVPGLGQLYTGRALRGAVALLVWLAVVTLALVLLLDPAGGAFAIVLAYILLLLAFIGVPVDAAIVASSGLRYPAHRMRRVALCIAIVLGFSELSTRAAEAIRSHLSEAFWAPSGGMVPTLYPGDHLFVDKRIYKRRPPERGEVVVFRAARDGQELVPIDANPTAPREQFIKRVIGLPGDRIRVEGDFVFINGSTLPLERGGFTTEGGRQFQVFTESLHGTTYTVAHDPNLDWPDFAEVVVPDDRFFLLGDNRDNSRDSRHFGTVARDHIVGRASHIYYSRHPATGDFAWARIGMRVQ